MTTMFGFFAAVAEPASQNTARQTVRKLSKVTSELKL
jgi:hypothetical protein